MNEYQPLPRKNGPMEPRLTAERRTELVSLLDDQDRLRAAFPRVAEYFEVAETLPGTGDPHADGAFEIRLLHYMTADPAASPNPYWSIVEPSVHEHQGHRVVNGGRPGGSAKLSFAQTILQATYAYAVPSPQTLEWIVSSAGGARIVELGAGRGYWAAQLADAGATVEAYDIEPPNTATNASFLSVRGQADTWYQVDGLPAFNTRLNQQADFALFLCWPPGWGNPMAAQALTEFEQAGGERLIYIGQPQGGMNATDEFFGALADRWRLESTDSEHVSWWELPDVAQSWVRR